MKRKKKSRPAGYSDSLMLKLCREAVLRHWGHRCAKCGKGEVEHHHVVRRSFLPLRYDPENGIALCRMCHSWADTGEGREWVRTMVDSAYLDSMEKFSGLKELLTYDRITREQWFANMKEMCETWE